MIGWEGECLTALGNDQRDIVLLFAGAELADVVNNRGQQDLGKQFTMSAKGLSQKGFSKLLSFTVGRFCYAVCVKGESSPEKSCRSSTEQFQSWKSPQHGRC